MNWKSLIQELLSRGLTQDQIAEQSGCSQSFVSDLLNGKRGKRIGFEKAQGLISLRDRLRKEAA
jgi:predicted transcriptional regulator